MSRRNILLTTGALVVVVAGVLVFTLTGGPPPAATASGPEQADTTTVVKTDLSVSQDFSGSLGFGDETPMKARVPGTVTWLPTAGAKVGRGGILFKVDNKPTVLFIGDTPTYRKLDKPGIQGPDAKVVNQNLADMGYLGKSAGRSDTFTEASMTAVKKWQKALKAEQTGIVDLPDALVLPAPVRVGTVTAQLGTAADGPLIGVTSDVKVVTLSLDDATGMEGGAKVNISLPNGNQATGVVAAIGKAPVKSADSNPAGSQSSGQSGDKLAVTITVDDPAAVGDLEGSVTVKLASTAKQGVLAVPVAALLALKEGGYALQVVTGSQTKLVPVKTGMFANGMVEVSGDISEGAKVVTAS